MAADWVASEVDSTERSHPLGVAEAALWHLPKFRDPRGSLVVAELPDDLPFAPKRIFTVYDVPGEDVRGEHAHRVCEQLLIAVHGALSVQIEDGTTCREVRMDVPTVALYMPPMIWGMQYRFSADAVLLVLASHAYESTDYIRDREDFLRAVAGGGASRAGAD